MRPAAGAPGTAAVHVGDRLDSAGSRSAVSVRPERQAPGVGAR